MYFHILLATYCIVHNYLLALKHIALALNGFCNYLIANSSKSNLYNPPNISSGSFLNIDSLPFCRSKSDNLANGSFFKVEICSSFLKWLLESGL